MPLIETKQIIFGIGLSSRFAAVAYQFSRKDAPLVVIQDWPAPGPWKQFRSLTVPFVAQYPHPLNFERFQWGFLAPTALEDEVEDNVMLRVALEWRHHPSAEPNPVDMEILKRLRRKHGELVVQSVVPQSNMKDFIVAIRDHVQKITQRKHGDANLEYTYILTIPPWFNSDQKETLLWLLDGSVGENPRLISDSAASLYHFTCRSSASALQTGDVVIHYHLGDDYSTLVAYKVEAQGSDLVLRPNYGDVVLVGWSDIEQNARRRLKVAGEVNSGEQWNQNVAVQFRKFLRTYVGLGPFRFWPKGQVTGRPISEWHGEGAYLWLDTRDMSIILDHIAAGLTKALGPCIIRYPQKKRLLLTGTLSDFPYIRLKFEHYRENHGVTILKSVDGSTFPARGAVAAFDPHRARPIEVLGDVIQWTVEGGRCGESSSDHLFQRPPPLGSWMAELTKTHAYFEPPPVPLPLPRPSQQPFPASSVSRPHEPEPSLHDRRGPVNGLPALKQRDQHISAAESRVGPEGRTIPDDDVRSWMSWTAYSEDTSGRWYDSSAARRSRVKRWIKKHGRFGREDRDSR